MDSSGNAHTATLEGTAAIIAGGKSGNCLSIDGSMGAFADVLGGNIFNSSESYTIAAWVYFPSFDGNYDILMGQDGTGGSTAFFQLAPVSGTGSGTGYQSEFVQPGVDPNPDNIFFFQYSTTPPGTIQWYYLTGVYTATASTWTLTYYVDGVLQSNANSSAPPGAAAPEGTGDFIIGAGKYGGARTAGPKAQYDGVRIYQQALTAAQVSTLYALAGD